MNKKGATTNPRRNSGHDAQGSSSKYTTIVYDSSKICKLENYGNKDLEDPIQDRKSSTESDSDDDYHDSLTIIEELIETLIDESDPENQSPEKAHDIATDHEADENDEYYDSLTTLEETLNDQRDPKGLKLETTDSTDSGQRGNLPQLTC